MIYQDPEESQLQQFHGAGVRVHYQEDEKPESQIQQFYEAGARAHQVLGVADFSTHELRRDVGDMTRAFQAQKKQLSDMGRALQEKKQQLRGQKDENYMQLQKNNNLVRQLKQQIEEHTENAHYLKIRLDASFNRETTLENSLSETREKLKWILCAVKWSIFSIFICYVIYVIFRFIYHLFSH